MLAAAMALMAQTEFALPPPPPPPPTFVSDYMPGPWFVPIDSRTARPLDEAIPILDGIADAARRLPDARVIACMSFALDEHPSAGEERRRLAKFMPMLRRRGATAVRAGKARDCTFTGPRRDVPGLIIFIGPRSD